METFLTVLAVISQGLFPSVGSQGIQQLNHWRSSGGNVEIASTTADIRVPSLTNCDTIDTDGSGILGCGSDDGGVGGSGFSTTSANYWSSVGLGFSTTSANHWSSRGLGFSTTSANTWAGFGLGFSTTSANYWRSLGLSFSTTSADAWGATKGYSTFAYLFPSNATSTALSFSNGLSVTGSTLAVTATTTTGALQAGSTALGANVALLSPLTGLTTSNSESVGGLFRVACGTTDLLCATMYASTTGSQRVLSLINNGTGYTGNVLHVRNEGTASAVNVIGSSVGLGVFKGSLKNGNNDSAVFSADVPTNSGLGQAYFGKCNGSTSTPCLNLLDEGSNTLFKVDGWGTTTAQELHVTNALNLLGTFANSLDDLCVAITGGSGLCDGSDSTGSGGAGLATSTNIADTWMIWGTSVADVGAEAAFTYDDATNLMTVQNASTTQLSASSALWYPAGTLAAPGLRLSGTQTGIYSSGVGLDIGIGGTSILQTTAGAIIPQIFMGTAHTGSSAETSYSFSGDANTGMWRSAADTLVLTAGGSDALVLRTSGASTTNLTNAGYASSTSLTVSATTTTLGLSVSGAVSLLGDYFANVGTWFDTRIEALTDVALQGTWNLSGATVKEKTYKSFSWPAGAASATTTTATTSIPLGSAFSAEAWSYGECWSGSGTVGWRVNDGTNQMDYRQATSTVSRFALSTNNTYTAGEKRFVDVGPMTASYLTCTFEVTVNN